MKFKELPEGYYHIHSIRREAVWVQLVDSPETAPEYVLAESNEMARVVHDGRQYRKKGELLDDKHVEFKTWEDMARYRKSKGARIGHVTRRINSGKPLKGKTLELALSLTGPDRGIAEKLKAGIPLDDYECHIMVDMRLLAARLGS